MATITQDMKYKQSLMKYAAAHGMSKASRKYNRARSFIYFWLKRWDGSMDSLRPESRRLHHHPNEHTPEELKLIHDMRRRNPRLGMVELWCKLRARGYSRCLESLWRVLKREGLIAVKEKDPYTPKPYQQMTHPGERVQIDVKVVPRKCIADPNLRLFQYTAIDEYSRYRITCRPYRYPCFLHPIQSMESLHFPQRPARSSAYNPPGCDRLRKLWKMDCRRAGQYGSRHIYAQPVL